MGNQRLGDVEFERRFVAQERRQLGLEGLGFGLGAGESQDVVGVT
jgi:hypothetical protein